MKSLGVIGSLALDRLPGSPPRVGGGPFYAAKALRALGRPATIAARCGTADREALLGSLVALGVPARCLAGRVTTAFSFSYDGEERQMSVDAVGDGWTPEDARGWVARTLDRVDWVHVAPLLRSDFPAATLAELARGRRLSFDGQGLVRRSQTGPLELDREFDPELLRHLSILKLSEEEARALVGDVEPVALRVLGVREVVVTLGSRGSLVVVDGAAEHVAASGVRDAPDPTGAGDAFAAGYLAARSSGHAPAASARRASALVASLLVPRGARPRRRFRSARS
jgi:sugar/nucleoside kinase (ribokinase family)